MQSHKPLPIYSFLRTFPNTHTNTSARLINREFLAVVFLPAPGATRNSSVYTSCRMDGPDARTLFGTNSKTYLTYFETAVTRILINFRCFDCFVKSLFLNIFY